ncbi:MAG: site-2 protease family protein [Gammaproteobacteria bacterium]|nr:site-2 protease family protein [Gammaproteobacteria bacterium]
MSLDGVQTENMKWSWKIFRLMGIDIYVHVTFFILIVWIGLSYWQTEESLIAVMSGIGFILALFTCVVLHEYGHALTARRYGISTRYITLLPIGGVASLERMPDDPKQEIIVALAGPAVNLVIALGLWLWLSLSGTLVAIDELSLTSGPFLERLMVVNIMITVFNMLPAFPMDGGRVLRAVLAMRMNYVQATRTAASVGQGLALWLGFLGLLYNPFLIFIALFVWIGAAAEAGSEQIKSTLAESTVGRAMLTDFQYLSPEAPLSRAIELTLAGSQKDFPVLSEGVMVGVLSQVDLLKGLQSRGERARVDEYMQDNVQSADIHEPLKEVLVRLQTCKCLLLSVTEENRLVGIVNIENIMELVRIQTALQEGRGFFTGKSAD